MLGAPALAARVGAITRWDSLPWITWGEPLTHLPPAAWLTKNAPSIEPVLRSSSLGAQLIAAERGIGGAVLPRVFCTTHELVAIPIAPALEATVAAFPVDELWLASSRSRRVLPRVAAVWDFLVDSAQALMSKAPRRP